VITGGLWTPSGAPRLVSVIPVPASMGSGSPVLFFLKYHEMHLKKKHDSLFFPLGPIIILENDQQM
jgi:hypothetical protein